MLRRRAAARLAATSLALSLAATLSGALPVPLTAGPASAAYDSDTRPNLVPLLAGYLDYWTPSGDDDLHGTVRSASVLSRDDSLAVWINQHATTAQRFKARQDARYQNDANTAYDQSLTVSTGMGQWLSRIYVEGRISGALPRTTALVNSTDGSTGDYADTGKAKAAYSHPRPFVASNPRAARVSGDSSSCAPSVVNASSQRAIRLGTSYADDDGNLDISRVAGTTDTTHQFSSRDVQLDSGYGTSGMCTGGSFPSGHTTTAYEAGITLATLLPEVGPELLARASEAGNNRIVLGVHYPLDVMGGRIAGEAALAARWSDAEFRTKVLEPARAELVAYLEKECGNTVAWCASHQNPYTSNPYGGDAMPGGTAQVVTGRASAVAVYRERMTYAFPRTGSSLDASVPAGAENLLRTTFPTLTSAQRRSVLAQTEVRSGYPLDLTADGGPAWQRINLAKAMSAHVQVADNGTATVVATGGRARVQRLG